MSYPCIMSNKECDGCMACKEEEKEYYCPLCGEAVEETFYVSTDGEIVGCENCVTTKEPREVEMD